MNELDHGEPSGSLFYVINLKKGNKMNNRDSESGQPKRRFSKAKYGATVMRLFRLMPTAQVARMLGLEPRKVSDYAYRNNYERCLGKDKAERKQVARENGKKGGRPRRKSLK